VDKVSVAALTADEEKAWRALTYVANHLVKVLGDDLAAQTRVSLSEYVVLVHLSEAPDTQLRIGDLASVSALSPSRMSRLVDGMASKGWVVKSRHADDARCTFATLTSSGLGILQQTYPMQLANVRRRVFDHLSERDVRTLGTALAKVRLALEEAERSSCDVSLTYE
jgi:DNA-binding MarR family transcriptional regulator